MDNKNEILEESMLFENFLKLFRMHDIPEIHKDQPVVFFKQNFGPQCIQLSDSISIIRENPDSEIKKIRFTEEINDKSPFSLN